MIGRPRISKTGRPTLHSVDVRVVHVGDRALHRVVRVALGVGRDRVHPGDALVAALDPGRTRLTVCARLFAEEVVEVAEVGGVDVGEREAVARGPWEWDADEARDHRAVFGRVDRAGHVCEATAAIRCLDGDLGLLHLLRLAVDDVGVWIGSEGQLVWREAPSGRDRVRPGEAARVADVDQAGRRRASRRRRPPCPGSSGGPGRGARSRPRGSAGCRRRGRARSRSPPCRSA